MSAHATKGGRKTLAAPSAPSLWARFKKPETRWAYLFLIPWMIGFIVFTAGPMVASAIMSFQKYDVINPARNIGFENYEKLISDPQARRALLNTVVYTVAHVPLSIIIALALALLLNQIRGRSAGIFRTVFYLPAMTPTVAIGVLFLLLLNGQNGAINKFLGIFGISGPSWTSDSKWIMPGI